MSNIPILGEYGFVPHNTNSKIVVSNTPIIKKEPEKQSSDYISDSTLGEIEKDNLLQNELKKETEPSKKYLAYFIKGFLFILTGLFIYFIFNKVKNSKSNEITISSPTNVIACSPIPTEFIHVKRNTYNPFLKNRVGYIPNSPNFPNFGWSE